MEKPVKLVYTQPQMLELNKKMLLSRGVTVEQIAEIAHRQQSKYTPNIPRRLAVESVEKLLSLRDVFHHVQLAANLDRLAEEGQFQGPIQDIIEKDLGLFGIDEALGLDMAGIYGTIGMTNFGDLDVNKPGIVKELNENGKIDGVCHTFLDDIVGALAAGASTRIAQILNEETAQEDIGVERLNIFEILEEK